MFQGSIYNVIQTKTNKSLNVRMDEQSSLYWTKQNKSYSKEYDLPAATTQIMDKIQEA